ncbi:hypothetical protein [Bradyrhizobium sp. Ai1a-2]|uniref:hypothetical protein n=1 Tax=Bradyrhizobium sp. Ai1a-2 TaxID=196490 RepID=UPI000488C6F5|nr:hypothetical protein [Bradyrhizobium sp. Ai1a-2]
MNKLLGDLHRFIEARRRSIPAGVHPAARATIDGWCVDMLAAVEEIDRLDRMVGQKISNETFAVLARSLADALERGTVDV